MHLPLSRTFFQRKTTLVASELLGKLLVHIQDGMRTSGYITETEAYVGETDLACHARSGRTARNVVMYGEAGHAYIYFTYGMHWCLNCVTESTGFPAAVLIRAVHPLEGLDMIRQNRRNRPEAELCNGPAKICQAFSIDGSLNGVDLCDPSSSLTILDGIPIPEERIIHSPRVGIQNVPEPWLSKPWNFRVAELAGLI